MTSRGIKFSSNQDEEKSRLLDNDTYEDDFEVRYSGDSDLALSKKRTRKLSDDEVYNLVDVGNIPKAPPLDQCVESEVQPGDTLTNISLKYNIPVAELKRVNNILSEQQFYALKRIKIPVRAASLLTELLPDANQAKGEAKLENGWYVRDIPSPVSGTGASSTVPSSPPSETEFENINYNNHLESLPVRESVPCSKQSRKAKRFLKNVDKDLARIKERLDIDDADDDSENDEKNDQMTSSLMIRGESINDDDDYNENETLFKSDQNGFVDSIRASKSRTACVLFVVIITVVLIVILVFAHYEFGAIEELHHQKEEEILHRNSAEKMGKTKTQGV